MYTSFTQILIVACLCVQLGHFLDLQMVSLMASSVVSHHSIQSSNLFAIAANIDCSVQHLSSYSLAGSFGRHIPVIGDPGSAAVFETLHHILYHTSDSAISCCVYSTCPGSYVDEHS